MTATVARLVEKGQNSRMWTGQDALRDALDVIGDKPVRQLMVAWYEESPDGTKRKMHYRVAGMSADENYAMLHAFAALAMENILGR